MPPSWMQDNIHGQGTWFYMSVSSKPFLMEWALYRRACQEGSDQIQGIEIGQGTRTGGPFAKMKYPTIGQLCLAALLLSMLSGFIVGYHYEVALAFISTVSIDALLPYGRIWRSLHFWSSQAFMLLLCLHIYEQRDFKGIESANQGKRWKLHWSIVSITLPISIYALFSGYVLKADATGQAAGAIAEHLLLKIPHIGNILNSLLLDISSQGLNRVYVVHIFLGFLCWLISTWYHLGRIRISQKAFYFILSFCIVLSLAISSPLDAPGMNPHLIKGPWFFLGIQELLRFFHPLTAGIVFPAFPLLLVALMSWIRKKKYLYLSFLFWCIAYSIVTVMAVSRSG